MDTIDLSDLGMITRMLPGVLPASNDAELLQAIAEALSLATAGPTARLGLRNATGSIYRVVYARGAAHALALTRIFEEFGLRDESSELDKARNHCDAIYARPSAHRRGNRADGVLSGKWQERRVRVERQA